MPTGVYDHNDHPTIFKKGHISWNKGKTKYKKINKELERLFLAKKLEQRKIAKILNIPPSTVSYLRKKFGIRRIEKWERWKGQTLSKKQKDLILGTLLGDGYARFGKCKHASISKSQSVKEYTLCKYKILERWCMSDLSKLRNEYSFTTISHPVFDVFCNMFYSNGRKRVTNLILKQINDFALAVWFMDDGSCCKSRYHGKSKISTYLNYQLRTDSFSYKENLLIKDWFKKKYSINTVISKQRGKYYLLFSKLGAEKLVKIIKPFTIPKLTYKLGINLENT